MILRCSRRLILRRVICYIILFSYEYCGKNAFNVSSAYQSRDEPVVASVINSKSLAAALAREQA